ncbi:protein kinase [Streptomyces sp. NPDC035033]|uniref:protein kinase domain-containing protein n=1 Tax=Streptomyces sp. NPDC035033 TaxID=3155368 RepID=UPI0033D47456
MATGDARPAALGHYEVDGPLGSGGMGDVYLAHSPSGRAVAVKVIREELAARPGFRERFAREVQAARQVSGAFTAPVLDADTTGPVPWMATAYVDGPTLAAVVAERGPLSADATWRLASGLCEALRDIHRAGLVHRDLKPGNILLADDGPRVIDFGISRVVDATALTQSGQILGTPLFMAPEQFRTPRDAGPAADVFALGAVLVYAATGHGPFDGDTPYAIAWNAVHEEPDLTGLPDSLRSVVVPCLSKDPAARPTPEALLTLLSSRRTRRASAKAAETRRLRVTRRRAALAAGAVLGAGALVAGAWTWWPDENPTGRATGPATATTRPTPKATAAPVRMPGWKPWSTRLRESPTGAMVDMAACQYEFPALWCSGPGTLAARVDARTGAVVWEQAGDHPAPVSMSVTPEGVYTLTSVHDNGVSRHTVRRFDPGTGEPAGEQTVLGADDCRLDEEYLLCLRNGRLVATVTPAAAEPAWSVEGRWSHFVTDPDQGSGGGTHVVRVDDKHQEVEVALLVTGSSKLQKKRSLPARSRVLGVHGNTALLISEDTGGLVFRQLSMATGAVRSIPLSQAEEVLGIIEDTLYTFRDGGVVSAYDLSSRKRVWSTTTLQHSLSAPREGGGRVHFTGLDGTTFALDRRTGGIVWQRKPPAGSVPGGTGPVPPSARPVVLGDIIVSSAPGARIHSFLAPSPTG